MLSRQLLSSLRWQGSLLRRSSNQLDSAIRLLRLHLGPKGRRLSLRGRAGGRGGDGQDRRRDWSEQFNLRSSNWQALKSLPTHLPKVVEELSNL